MNVNISRFNRSVVIAALALSLGLVGCGGGSSEGTAPVVSSPPQAGPVETSGATLALAGATMTIEAWSAPQQVQLVVDGADGEALTIEVTEQPVHGTLTLDHALLSVTYEPAGVGFFNDAFSVRVTAGEAFSDAISVPVRYADRNENGLPDFADPEMATATALTGTIEADTRLYPGVYVVEGRLEVAANATLTVDPGVTMLYRDGATLQVFGTLIVDASHEALARMLPADIDPAGWGGVHLRQGSAPTTLVGDVYQGGSLFRGVEIAGVRETGQLNNPVISLCPALTTYDERSEYLFEEVLIHGTLGTQGIRYIDKCAAVSGFPHIVVRRSLFHVDDRSFASEHPLYQYPTQVFSAGSVDMQDSAVRGHFHGSMNYAWWAASIDHSELDLLPAGPKAAPGVNVTFGWGPGFALTNSVVAGTVFIDAATGEADAAVTGNAFVQGADALMFEVLAEARDRATITLGANFYAFATSEAEAVLDGQTVNGRAILDISSRLADYPAAGPRDAAQPALSALAKRLGIEKGER